ncbi:MAG: GNAT family N-acetyltransferase [Candidatus Pacebacteria bacterium]|nr:GNAT family N-acetyltransferase [Candidatus Paceibacterota bacterium]
MSAKIIFDKNNKKYKLTTELTDEFLNQMIAAAHTDQQIIDQTSDSKRFSSLASTLEWLRKAKKYFFVLSPIKNQTNLTGIIWFENLDLPPTLKNKYPNSDWTFGIRIYQPYRSQGLALPFMKIAFQNLTKILPNKQIWLSTHLSNQVAAGLYQKFGFKKIGETNNKAYFIFQNKT